MEVKSCCLDLTQCIITGNRRNAFKRINGSFIVGKRLFIAVILKDAWLSCDLQADNKEHWDWSLHVPLNHSQNAIWRHRLKLITWKYITTLQMKILNSPLPTRRPFSPRGRAVRTHVRESHLFQVSSLSPQIQWAYWQRAVRSCLDCLEQPSTYSTSSLQCFRLISPELEPIVNIFLFNVASMGL